jgi:D-alanyl-D-alanine carboxypeptidase
MKKKKLIRVIISLVILNLGVISFIYLNFYNKKENSKSKVDTPTKEVVNEDQEEQNHYKSYYYYEEENLERYIAYHSLNIEMATGDVVWRVNAKVDQLPYENIVVLNEDSMHDKTALINKFYRLPDDFEPRDLIGIGDGNWLDRETYEAFLEMSAVAESEGAILTPGSTYRSIDSQRGLYESYVDRDGQELADTYSARAGSSEHHTGRAIDFVGEDWTLSTFEYTYASQWIQENAWEYGFILRYPKDYVDVTRYMYEPWHVTYVGIEVSRIMHQEGISTLEEYHVKFVDHQPE